jgi:hypothetical protein
MTLDHAAIDELLALRQHRHDGALAVQHTRRLAHEPIAARWFESKTAHSSQ